MKITQKDVEKVAHLARLCLNEDELATMTEQLDNILSYVDKLEELDTQGVPVTTHVFSISNAFRDDEVVPSLSQEEALKNGARTDSDSFLVPRVI